MKNNKKISRGALLYMLSAFVIKGLGAIYKIPLYNLLGSYGIGLYQMVFPVYALLLTFSGSGVASALTKIISGGANKRQTLIKCLTIFIPFGCLFTAILYVFSDKIALLQGDKNCALAYKTICFSILLVSIISCLRGYFQGNNSFKQTAISQIIEQVIKMIAGLILLNVIVCSDYEKTALACLSVTFSEIVALIYLLIKYAKTTSRQDVLGENVTYKQLLLYVIPLTVTSLMLPLASFIDSFIVINSLKKYMQNATSLFGLYTGGVDTVIGLPVSVLLALSVSFLPYLTKNKGKNYKNLLFYTLICAFISYAWIVLFSKTIVNVIFKSVKNYKNILVKLMQLGSINIICLSMLQTTNTILLSMGKQFVPIITMAVGIFLKILVDLLVISLPNINIYGMIISDFVCYFVAFIINFSYIKKLKKGSITNENNVDRVGRKCKFNSVKGCRVN